jgi:hypothetical protein
METWICACCGQPNSVTGAVCFMCGATYGHSRAIELRKQAEAQTERMRRNWLDEKQRREDAEKRAWSAERQLQELAAPVPIPDDSTVPREIPR